MTKQPSIGTYTAYQLSCYETLASKHQYITPGHFFAGITKLEDALHLDILKYLDIPQQTIPALQAEIAAILKLLSDFKIPPRDVRHKIREILGKGNYERTEKEIVHRSPELKNAFSRAEEIANEDNSEYIFLHYLLAALLEIPNTKIHQLLTELNVDKDAFHKAALNMKIEIKKGQPGGSYLDTYGTDLVQQARDGEIKACINRKEEMIQIIRTLEREKKNNAVLVGDAGVGKTAIVQGIACRIATGNIPPPFQKKRIIQISASSLVGGTKYRGEFEERMNNIILEVSASADIILFIDEMHLLVGAGSAGGAMDAANILKPALSEGKIKLIGATTTHEYRQYIEKDAALERRFQKITVNEPSIEQTKIILTGIIPRLKNHHRNIEITQQAIDAAIQLTVRYMPNRRLPDKAYDVLDEACSKARFKDVSYRHCKEDTDVKLSCIVTKELVAEIISEKTGIPVTQMTAEETERFNHMPAIIKKRVVGQDQAVEAVCRIIINHRLGLIVDKNKPIGVFIFAGPTGVGKTELSKALAEFLFGTEERIIRLDMSEYMEKHMVARLIGSPPGYVGFEQGGQLTEALYKMPYAIVLLDEIEKAHPDVVNIFLQVFSDGRLTDGQGRTIDAKNAVFIMTSNLGYIKSKDSQIGYQLGHEITPETIKAAISKHFSPEFLNRLDEIIFFQKLNKETMPKIVKNQIEIIRKLLQEKYEIKLEITEKAIQWLAEKGYDDKLGARPLIRFIQKELPNEIGGRILNDQIRRTHIINIDIENDQIKIDAWGIETEK